MGLCSHIEKTRGYRRKKDHSMLLRGFTPALDRGVVQVAQADHQ